MKPCAELRLGWPNAGWKNPPQSLPRTRTRAPSRPVRGRSPQGREASCLVVPDRLRRSWSRFGPGRFGAVDLNGRVGRQLAEQAAFLKQAPGSVVQNHFAPSQTRPVRPLEAGRGTKFEVLPAEPAGAIDRTCRRGEGSEQKRR